VCFLATGAVVRLVAPLLGDKASDPGVVCVDEGGRFAVSLVGGHGGGANALAVEVGELLGAEPVVTTATDAVGIPGLDTLGLPVEGDVAGVTRALLDGEPVVLDAEVAWPLPPVPFAERGAYTVRLTDRAVRPGAHEVLLRPPSLVVGVGASRAPRPTRSSR
jgi:cobalt-precorrin 5A hydrolase/precorrin-3B C17-methyltransferase